MPLRGPCHAWIVGFIAAEGTFVVTHLRTRKKFMFAIELGATDAGACELVADFFGCGTLHHYPRRKPHYDDTVRFQISRHQDLVERVVPFLDEHLPPSYKRTQYDAWRDELLDYWEHDARRRRTCTVEDCPDPQRAKGLCRHHYFEVYRR